MSEALLQVFDTLEIETEHLVSLAHCVAEKYEDLSLAKGLLEMDLQSDLSPEELLKQL